MLSFALAALSPDTPRGPIIWVIGAVFLVAALVVVYFIWRAPDLPDETDEVYEGEWLDRQSPADETSASGNAADDKKEPERES